MLWEVDITPLPGQPDLDGSRVASEAQDMGIADGLQVRSVRGYLVQGDIDQQQIANLAASLFSDQVVESVNVAVVGDDSLCEPPPGCQQVLHVMRKSGVMDPVAQSAERAIRDLGIDINAVRTFRKYWISSLSADAVERLSMKVLANDSIEQVIAGKLELDSIELGNPYEFKLQTIPIRELDDGLSNRSAKLVSCTFRSQKCKRFKHIFVSWIVTRRISSWNRWCKRGANIAAIKRWRDVSPTVTSGANAISPTC